MTEHIPRHRLPQNQGRGFELNRIWSKIALLDCGYLMCVDIHLEIIHPAAVSGAEDDRLLLERGLENARHGAKKTREVPLHFIKAEPRVIFECIGRVECTLLL